MAVDTVTTWTSCLKITRADGVVVGITELDVPLTIAGVTYATVAGYTPTTFSATSDLAVNNADVQGLFDAAGIARADLLAGLYNNAAVEFFIWNWAAGTLVKTLATGNFGVFTFLQGRFVAEFRSLAQRLQQSIGEVYSPSCRAELGDSRCKVNVAPLTVTGTMDSQTDGFTLVDAARTEAVNTWRGGKITFTSGLNSGHAYEVKTSTATGILTLLLPVPYAVGADTYSLAPGCDNSIATCRDRYNNVINFRGEPWMPGTLAMLTTGNQQSGQKPIIGVDPGAPLGATSGPYTVTTGGATSSFAATGLTEANAYWNLARVIWQTGANTGFFSAVSAYTVGNVVLHDAMPQPITAGDTFTLTLP